MTDVEVIRKALANPLEGTDFSGLGVLYRGKVRDNYTTEDGRRFLITSDRISAFDRVLGTLPLKGQVLQHVTSFWFDKTAHIAPNHVISTPDPNVLEAKECTPLGAEMIVRAYITGVTDTSIWTAYKKGKREFCGHALPEGLKKNDKLEKPILTPSTKAPRGEHDKSLSREALIEGKHISAEDFDAAAEIAMRLFDFGQKHCAERGLILVDTKYEFGRDRDGNVVVIDEIHTPDSSRYWYAETYEERLSQGLEPQSFDKEYVRRFLAEQGFKGDGDIPVIPDDVKVEAVRRYIEACETIIGETFEPNLEEPIARMSKNLGLAERTP
ncbi:phosphoribosylaminoimidazolesuccinocarboxamide synthase [Endomicrobium sp. AH-315-J14]|nr:phosphoribosylaminoimidazolesuccinocarboxamide synthase [Endomicrobium sp. AH-315-J14]